MNKKKIKRLGFLFLWIIGVSALTITIFYILQKIAEEPIVNTILEQNADSNIDGPVVFVLMMATTIAIIFPIANVLSMLISLATAHYKDISFRTWELYFIVFVPAAIFNFPVLLFQPTIALITIVVQIIVFIGYLKWEH